MNILLITFCFVGFMVSEIQIVSVFGYFPQVMYHEQFTWKKKQISIQKFI